MPGPPFLPHNPPPWNSSEPALHLTVGIFHFRMLLFLAYFFYTQKFIFKWARVCVWGGGLPLQSVVFSSPVPASLGGQETRGGQVRPGPEPGELSYWWPWEVALGIQFSKCHLATPHPTPDLPSGIPPVLKLQVCICDNG